MPLPALRFVLLSPLVILATAALADNAEDCLDRSLTLEAQRAACDLAIPATEDPATRADLLAERSRSYRLQGDLAAAQADIAEALALAPDHPDVLIDQSLLLTAQGDPEGADASAALAVGAAPDYGRALIVRMGTLADLGQPDACLELAPRAIAAWPDSSYSYAGRARCLADAGQLEASLPDSEKAIALGTTEAADFTNYGITLEGLGRVDDAIAAYTQALALDPNFGNAHYSLVYTFARHDRVPEALAAYDAALSLGLGETTDIADNTAWTLYEQGHYDEALAMVEAYLATKPEPTAEEASEFDTRAHILAALGRPDEATAAWMQAVALEGDSRAAGYEEMLRGLGFGPSQGLEAAIRECAATGAACLLY